MSNYLLIIASSAVADSIKVWMGRAGATPAIQATDVVDIALNDDRRLIYVARKGRNDLDPRGAQIFRGHAIDFNRQRLIFGMEGAALAGEAAATYASAPIEGCYLAADWDPYRVQISNDLFGMCSLFSFAEAECVAFSDSCFCSPDSARRWAIPTSSTPWRRTPGHGGTPWRDRWSARTRS